jgi:tetratricopeptide (TPR) repeat protein
LNSYESLELSAALAAFQRAASLDDQHAVTQAWLSRVLLLLGRRNEAVAAALRARQLVTSDTPQVDSTFIEAVLAESQSDATSAERRYRELTEHEPDDMAAQIELADFLKRQVQDQAAIAAYQAALRLGGGFARLRVDLCQLYARINELPLAEAAANEALATFRAAGHRGGEAQALLCLADAQRQGGAGRLAEARRNIESARTIFESLGYEYGLSRVYQYAGLVETGGRNYRGAATLFEQALSRSRAIGNHLIEGNALMNLGVAFELLGQRPQVLKYYQEARDFYQRTGDERRAAEQEANAAVLLVDHGSDQGAALRRLARARATLEKLGNVEFQVIAMEADAASSLYAGRHDEARRHLHSAISLAKERQIGNRVVFASIRLAQSYFATAEYEAARALLEETAATAAGRDEPGVTILLGRTYSRLGDLERARDLLEKARSAVEASGQLWLAPSADTALGEVALESGNPGEARAWFDRAAGYWTDDLPDASSVEAKCYLGVLDPVPSTALQTIAASVEQARRMGRLAVEALCRIQEARLRLSMRQGAEALATLSEIPIGAGQTVGKEVQAQIHYWRSRALSARGERRDAEADSARARTLIQELQVSVPPAYRDGFSARAVVRQLR